MTQNQLIYPSLNLFIYDIYQGLGQEKSELLENQIRFWRRIDLDFDQQIIQLEKYRNLEASKIKISANEAANFRNIYKEAEIKIKTIEENPESQPNWQIRKNLENIDGFLIAKILEDSYALHINCSGEKNPQDINKIAEIKQNILQQINGKPQGSLGQTWLLWAKLETGTNPSEIAKECAETIVDNLNKDYLKPCGTWLGAELFEYQQIPTEWGNKEWAELNQTNQHLIICLFPPQTKTPEELSNLIKPNYEQLKQIFLNRHKVIWAYWQGHLIKQKLKQHYTEIKTLIIKKDQIKKQVEENKLNLKQLQLDLLKALNQLSEYTIELNQLKAQAHTIDVNIQNYQKHWQQTPAEFITYAQHYQQQIEFDYDNLSSKTLPLENFIRTLEGINEIQQTKSEQALARTIGITGTALAASSLTATIISTQIPSPTPAKNEQPVTILDASVWSGGMFLLAAFLAWLFLKER